MSTTVGPSALLRDQAAAVLRGNDQGRWTKAAPRLYPHQWSWDSAFIAIGWAHVDLRRALTELKQLFAAQWATGMVPHIVFRTGPEQQPEIRTRVRALFPRLVSWRPTLARTPAWTPGPSRIRPSGRPTGTTTGTWAWSGCCASTATTTR
jgi:hypothetical protein